MTDDSSRDLKTFGAVRISHDTEVRVAFGEYRSKPSIDVRLFHQRDPDNDFAATGKGIGLRPHQFVRLLDLLEDAEDFLIEKGLIEDAGTE